MEPSVVGGKEARLAIPAVILAAGAGRRLQSGKAKLPKPLTPILGLTLLERSILTCRQVGVREFFIVVGHRKDEIIPHIEQLGRRYKVELRTVVNKDWELGNGTSVSACSSLIAGPFLLMMCDHLFEPEILSSLMRHDDGTDVCRMVVEDRSDHVFDMEDATRVRLDGDEITAIGKGLESYDAVDSGAFLCRPILFEALRKAQSDGDGSLSAGIRELIGKRKVQAVPIGDRFWLDVDTQESVAHANSRLMANLDKPSEDGYVSHFLNRPVSRLISRWLVRLPVAPSAITFFSFILALVGAYCFSLGEYAWTLLAGILVQVASVVDGCDGEIARLKLRASAFGGWLDTILDRYADVAIAVGISYGYWLKQPGVFAWLGGIVALSGFLLASYAKKEYALRYSTTPPAGVIGKLIKRDLRLFVIFLAAVVNQPFEGMVLLGLLSHLGVFWLFLTVAAEDKT